ncbi:MAG: pseudaminic acid synthase [Mariprofundaceae bacterium]|nr:pseudaminic acid synthase [Mariprofundaceae bacterium]
MTESSTATDIIGMLGEGTPPFVIAELSGNHNGSLEKALEIVRLAARAGVDALKLQTFTADSMTLDMAKDDFMANPDSAWRGKKLYELYQQASTPRAWHGPVFDLCRELGIIAFSTPFDHDAVEFLEELDVPLYKIASFEIVDLPLIERVAATGKPVIMSTGMATLEEIDEAVQAARDNGCKDLVLLKCTSAYPAPPKDANLRAIPLLRERYGCPVGLSDHTLGIGVAIASVAYGASVIEKHFTDSRSEGGVDSAFSMEPEEMAQLVVEANRAWQAAGEAHIGPVGAEHNARNKRRSLYVIQEMKAGDPATLENIRSIRPARGLAPKYLKEILGKRAVKDIERGTPVSRELFV